jgi:Bacterial PH domain
MASASVYYNAEVETETIRKPQAPAAFAVAPLDEYALRLTNGLAYLGGLLMLPLLFAYLSNLRWEGLLIPVALALAVAFFLLLCYGAQPRLYELVGGELRIRRRLWRPLRVPLSVVSGASLATPLSDVPVRRVRFAFNAGIFGYQGPFRLTPYGEVFFLATNRARLVAVAREGRTALILSPERPREFVEALNQLRTSEALEALEEV